MIDKKSKIKEFINKSQSNEFTFDDIYKSIYSLLIETFAGLTISKSSPKQL